MKKTLPLKFYQQDTLTVAQQLLGKILVRQIGQKLIKGRIVETEAYLGPEDQASHASRGLTARTRLMFGPAGLAYIYLIYGLYYCFNVVTEKEGKAGAVLIRALEPLENLEPSLKTNGPGKLCRALQITTKFLGHDLRQKPLWLEESQTKIQAQEIVKAKRVGIDYAGPWKDKLWRFYLKDNPWVSVKN